MLIEKKKLQRHIGKTPRRSGDRDSGMWEDLGRYWGFWGKDEAGKGLGLASLSNSGQLWATGLVPSCLAPGPGMMKAE